ncbi:hypothetical protein CAQU_12460 [Corynebacterium aquilae DSM 44791]|uniref:Uncharacterized protein n=1 Tax=Corynebacterium aquilae DSM 44791 TaxID=1431546 RepID=A0A1L7CIM8_9CORY|nr:hypothetical protein CAQU_12460 [Corynebacterium aquilae DSM 44791]
MRKTHTLIVVILLAAASMIATTHTNTHDTATNHSTATTPHPTFTVTPHRCSNQCTSNNPPTMTTPQNKHR